MTQFRIPKKPCPKCGAHLRYLGGGCVPCSRAKAIARYHGSEEVKARNKASAREWQKANPEKRRAYVEAHREEIREYHRRYDAERRKKAKAS